MALGMNTEVSKAMPSPIFLCLPLEDQTRALSYYSSVMPACHLDLAMMAADYLSEVLIKSHINASNLLWSWHLFTATKQWLRE